MSEQLRAATLRKLFPEIEQLRIVLTFSDPSSRSRPPSAQTHTLYSAASAFFRFACPCADCDGDFDLTDAVGTLIAKSGGRRRIASLEGELTCRGVRFRAHVAHQAPCSMHLSFQLVSESHGPE